MNILKIIFTLAAALATCMSIQVLLPKDVLVRSLCICIENEKLPATYQTKEGAVKDRNAKTLLSGALSEEISERLTMIGDLMDEKASDRNINKTKLDANHQGWLLTQALIGGKYRAPNIDHDSASHIDADIAASLNISAARIGSWVTKSAKQLISNTTSDTLPSFAHYEKLATSLELVRDGYNSTVSTKVSEWKRNGSMGVMELTDEYSAKKPLKYYQVGNVVMVSITNTADEVTSFVLTTVHYGRVIELLRSIGVISTALPYIYGIESSSSTVEKIAKKFITMGVKYPNAVGGIFKSARQLLFLMGDDSKVMGSSPASMHISGLTGPKFDEAEKLAHWLIGLTNDRKSALNLSNIFKAVLHPDAEMSEVFDSIKGAQTPNKPDPSVVPSFNGIARKAIYSSLSRQRMDVRVEAIDPEDSMTTAFARSVNATSVPTSTLMKAGYTKWGGVRFLPVRGIFDGDKQDIPVSNKSSAPDARLDEKHIDSIGNITTFSQLQDIRKRLKAVNDIVTSLDGSSDLDFKQARKRFYNVIKSHEEFEAKYLANGTSIDDIPSDDLAKFVKSDPDNAYTILTEPKLGEVHKEVTRMFYMAQQALKIMTQVCERFTKKVISKASGISITKSYRGRRKELEAMLNAYTGHIIDNGGDSCSVFISFDMSEFSKKFPNELVRAIGQILSELSGEDWMSRIDIFFRAAVVYHNSRGYVDYVTGIKGGFEGFLNFLWTLIMKVVMDIAAHSTGVQGVLAVFSDDGLLRLNVTGSLDEVRDKVIKIQGVFKSHGLIFHMDKTVASIEILEYLGVYGERGMISATWMKELMSIGKRNKTPGLTTVADKISLWASQCSSVAKAGGPTFLCSFLSTFLTVKTLRRLNQTAPSLALACLTIIPYSAGGFRIPSITESSLLSAIEPLAEFGSDIELLYDVAPAYASAIAKRVFSNLKRESSSERTLITGSLLQTTLSDTSGLSLARELIEKSSIATKGQKNPFTSSIVGEILGELKRSTNIRARPIRNLIQSVPDVIEYNKSIAIIKSSAALKFVDRSEIRKTQGKDTRKCRNSISKWVDEMRCYDGRVGRIKSTDFTSSILTKLYPSYSLARLIDSPRTALTVVLEDGDIMSTTEYSADAKLSGQTYLEPAAKFLGAQLSPEYSAESTASTAQRRNERFVCSAARLVASNPSLLGMYYIVANAFSLPCPTLPSATVISSHRSPKNFGHNAVAAFIPTPFHALINSRMSNKMWRSIAAVLPDGSYPRSDKTTYVTASGISTYLNKFYSIDTSKAIEYGFTTTLYNVRDIVLNTSNPVMTTCAFPDSSLIDTDATASFTSILVEEEAQARHMDSVTYSIGLIDCISDTPVTKAIFLTRMESWLFSSLNDGSPGTSSVCPAVIPGPWKTEIYLESAVSVGYRLSSPLTRAVIARTFSGFIGSLGDQTVRKGLNNWHLHGELMDKVYKNAEHMEALGVSVAIVAGCLSKLEVSTELEISLNELNVSSNDGMALIITTLQRLGVLGGAESPTVVINTDSFADTKMSRAVKTSVQNAVNMALQSALAEASSTFGNINKKIADANINFITVVKNMIRPSGHRSTPFNKHMVAIQLLKLELFIASCTSRELTEVTTADLVGYRVPDFVCRRVIALNMVIAGRTDKTSGEDMRNTLMNEGVPAWAHSRVSYIIRRLSRTYSSNSITITNIMTNHFFMQELINYVTHTYNTILKQAVSRLEVIHMREAAAVAGRTAGTPVEDASLISAVVDYDIFIGPEDEIKEFKGDDAFCDILSSLFLAHYYRWGTSGYMSEPWMNRLFIRDGIHGDAGVVIRNKDSSPIREQVTDGSYTLSITSYTGRETAVNNYLMVNGLPGGMAVIASGGSSFYVLAIIPRGVRTINTEATRTPRYTGEASTNVNIMSFTKTAARMGELSRVLGARTRIAPQAGEFAALVIQQAYQRAVGARRTIVDNDVTLVAISELSQGSWSMDSGLRVLALFCAWICTEGEVNRRTYREHMDSVKGMSNSVDPSRRAKVFNAASAVFEWLRLVRISGSSSIDSRSVTKIVNAVSRSDIPGGSPTAIYNYAPVGVEVLTRERGGTSFDDFIDNVISTIFIIPVAPKAPAQNHIGFESGSESDSEDW